MNIKVYGLYRSGTNLMVYWLNRVYGLSLEGNEYGHKHDFIDYRAFPNRSLDGFWFVVCIRDPYVFSVRLAAALCVPPSPCFSRWCAQYWQRMICYWRDELPATRTIFVPYEQLLENTESIRQSIETTFGLEPTGTTDLPSQYIATDERLTDMTYNRRKDVLLRLDKAKLQLESCKYIEQLIDWDMAADYGYAREG